jgi:small-conductance mechanosensitive channel
MTLTKWIPIEKIQPLIGYEAFAISVVLMFLSYLFYFLFMKGLSEKRHGQLRRRFLMTSLVVGLSGLTALLHWLLFYYSAYDPIIVKIADYIGLLALILGAVAIIKVAQIFIYLYLFFSNMTTGVPRLISNLFTFVFSIILLCTLCSTVFGLNIATIATTSAVFSLVLGLALQDTLGNFFSGLALQINQSFNIGDWVEIQSGDQKWIGQIHEVNWRVTYLMTFADELIMFPNKTIAQSQIVLLNNDLRPVRLNQMFRFNYDTPIETAKKALLEGFEGFQEIMKTPAPTTLVTETTESWVTIKVFYSLHDYGSRFRVGDALISQIMKKIREHDLKLAHQTISVRN